MRRADRLFRLVHLIRMYRVVTARRLANELEVSERTVYRDVNDLVASGIPIRGEAGVGYALDPGFDMPPLMFTVDEIDALVLGVRMVEAWCGPELAGAARDVLSKVEHSLPRRHRSRVERTAMFVPNLGWTLPGAEQLATLRESIRERTVLWMVYEDGAGARSDRLVWPLGLFFWGPKATLAAWCTLRDGFRSFRLDRIVALEPRNERFDPEPGRTIVDFVRQVRDEDATAG